MPNPSMKLATTEAQPGEVIRKPGSSVLARILIILSVFSAAVLLLSDLPWITTQAHAYLSSIPLALAGIAYALLQFGLRPARRVLLKRLLLAITFIGWAVDQLLPAGPVATLIGDIVIAAFVLDLYWISQEQ